VFYTVNAVTRPGIDPSRVMRVRKSGAAPTVVAESVMMPYALAVAGSYLYCSSVSPTPQTLYAVDKLASRSRW